MRSATAALLWLLMMSGISLSAREPRFQQSTPVHLDKQGEKWAQKTLRQMSLEQKVGQIFMIWSRAHFMNVQSPEYLHLRDTMRKYHIGGFGITVRSEDGLLYKTEPLEVAMLTNQLQADSEIPLIFAADFERGLGMRFDDTTGFPHAMAFGAAQDVEYARSAARITAQEARAVGVQWNWFPDADVNSNPANPVINTRSFSDDPAVVSQMVRAYIEGAHEAGMLVTAKHFPGHGDTDTDSHISVPVVNGDATHLENIELVPFRAAIQAGVDAILVAHVSVPALDPDAHRVASISPPIVTGLLKEKMGFQGLVITDALEMNGLTRLFAASSEGAGRAAVEALKAGNDMLLIPADLDGAYQGVLQAVHSGDISVERIDQSVLKVLRMKASVGLNRARMVDIGIVKALVGQPQSLEAAQVIADNAVTLVRDNHQVLPLRPQHYGTSQPTHPYSTTGGTPSRTLLLVFSSDIRSEYGRVMDEQFKVRIPNARTIYIDPHTVAGLSDSVMQAVQLAEVVVAAVYESPIAGKELQEPVGSSKASVVVESPVAGLLKTLLNEAASKIVIVSLGNPYIAEQFSAVQTYLCTFSSMPVSEISAVKALFGEIPMSGRLPVTIPNIATRGSAVASSTRISTGGTE